MRVGICGYPGSGKTTVFRALAPDARGGSIGSIKVPDPRVDRLAAIYKPRKTVYAEITFVDLEGGTGRRAEVFNSAAIQGMRNADVLVHVVRAFPNPYLSEEPDPERDVRRFQEEILLLDMGILDRRAERWKKEARRGLEVQVNQRCLDHLAEGLPLRSLDLSEEETATLQGIQLLSRTPLITLYNLSEEAWDDPTFAHLRQQRQPGPNELSMGICAALEAELAEMEPEEQQEMLEGLGLEEPARNAFIRAAYQLLDLISFLTCGPDECRAWSIKRGTTAKKAAGRVHSDIERGFIRAESFWLEDLEEAGSEAALKASGKLRVEGRDHVVQDGEILHFRFNV